MQLVRKTIADQHRTVTTAAVPAKATRVVVPPELTVLVGRCRCLGESDQSPTCRATLLYVTNVAAATSGVRSTHREKNNPRGKVGQKLSLPARAAEAVGPAKRLLWVFLGWAAGKGVIVGDDKGM